jgi:DNA mismatch endonuclease (patch repair protein)
VFPVERIAVLVHGCFWHGCPVCNLPQPKANAEFWAAKLDGNVERDQKVEQQLREQGWEVVVVWEHALRADIDVVADELVHLRATRRSAMVAGCSADTAGRDAMRQKPARAVRP